MGGCGQGGPKSGLGFILALEWSSCGQQVFTFDVFLKKINVEIIYMYICKVVFVLKDIQGEASSSSVIGFSSSHDPVIEWPVTAILTDGNFVVYIRYIKFI